MPAIDIVMIDDLAATVAATIRQVHDGVRLAREQGIQAELPAKIDFQINVVAKWQDSELQMQGGETTTTTESGGYTDNGTSDQTGTDTNTGSTTDRSTGYQTDTDSGSSTESSSGSNVTVSEGSHSHVNNGTVTVTNTEL